MNPSDFDADAPHVPCVAGLLAATLALMTTWAAPEPAARIDARQQRMLIARKLVSNLGLLREHPQVGPALRQVIGKLHERWSRIADESAGASQALADPACAGASVALH